MSNEYKDWKADLRETFEDKVKELNIQYDGWVNSFIPHLKDELFDLLGSYVEQFNVLEIKEKFGKKSILFLPNALLQIFCSKLLKKGLSILAFLTIL